MPIDLFLKKLPSYIDAALIISPVNRRYFTSFPSSDGILLITGNESVFYTDSRYIEAAEKTIDSCQVEESSNVFNKIAERLKNNNLSSVAVEADGITVKQFEALKRTPELKDFGFISDGEIDKIISGLRSVKTPDEIEKIKKAQKIAEDGFLHILNYIKKGVTEKDARLELDYYMLKNGAEALSFDTIAVSGKNSSMPHGVPSEKPIEDGDFVTLDFGAVYEGYHSDMTRTVAVGYASDKMRKVYDAVLLANEEALKALKPGLSCKDGDKAARDVIKNEGFGEFFGHATGHGVGLEIHEDPVLSPKAENKLKVGNIVTVEPGIYIPNEFGVRIEDMALITENGCENLTKSQKSLIIL